MSFPKFCNSALVINCGLVDIVLATVAILAFVNAGVIAFCVSFTG